MMKSFEDIQTAGKEGFEAFTASTTAMTKGYQTVAQEVADFSTKRLLKFSRLSPRKLLKLQLLR
jgi:hypothetical protein